jgi:hypothetical protein
VHVVDLGHGQAFLVELLEQVGHEVAVENGHRGAFGIETAPIGPGEIEKVLEQDSVTDKILMADAQEFDVGGAGDGFGNVGLVREETFEP